MTEAVIKKANAAEGEVDPDNYNSMLGQFSPPNSILKPDRQKSMINVNPPTMDYCTGSSSNANGADALNLDLSGSYGNYSFSLSENSDGSTNAYSKIDESMSGSGSTPLPKFQSHGTHGSVALAQSYIGNETASSSLNNNNNLPSTSCISNASVMTPNDDDEDEVAAPPGRASPATRKDKKGREPGDENAGIVEELEEDDDDDEGDDEDYPHAQTVPNAIEAATFKVTDWLEYKSCGNNAGATSTSNIDDNAITINEQIRKATSAPLSLSSSSSLSTKELSSSPPFSFSEGTIVPALNLNILEKPFVAEKSSGLENNAAAAAASLNLSSSNGGATLLQPQVLDSLCQSQHYKERLPEHHGRKQAHPHRAPLLFDPLHSSNAGIVFRFPPGKKKASLPSSPTPINCASGSPLNNCMGPISVSAGMDQDQATLATAPQKLNQPSWKKVAPRKHKHASASSLSTATLKSYLPVLCRQYKVANDGKLKTDLVDVLKKSFDWLSYSSLSLGLNSALLDMLASPSPRWSKMSALQLAKAKEFSKRTRQAILQRNRRRSFNDEGVGVIGHIDLGNESADGDDDEDRDHHPRAPADELDDDENEAEVDNANNGNEDEDDNVDGDGVGDEDDDDDDDDDEDDCKHRKRKDGRGRGRPPKCSSNNITSNNNYRKHQTAYLHSDEEEEEYDLGNSNEYDEIEGFNSDQEFDHPRNDEKTKLSPKGAYAKRPYQKKKKNVETLQNAPRLDSEEEENDSPADQDCENHNWRRLDSGKSTVSQIAQSGFSSGYPFQAGLAPGMHLYSSAAGGVNGSAFINSPMLLSPSMHSNPNLYPHNASNNSNNNNNTNIVTQSTKNRKRSSNSVSSISSVNSVRGRGGGRTSGSNGTKECASCGTRKTPMWRDDSEGVPLCNACGIRFKKNKMKCSSCNYIPRKDDSMVSCTRCSMPVIPCKR